MDDFENIFQTIENVARSHYGPQTLESGFAPKPDLLGGDIDNEFTIGIKNGKGSLSCKKITFRVKIKGSLTVLLPEEGSWNIIVKLNGKTALNIKDALFDSSEEFELSTDYITEIAFVTEWSLNEDVLLRIRLKGKY